MERLYRRNTVREAIRAGRRQMTRLWLQQGSQDEQLQALHEEAAARRIPIVSASKEELGNLAQDGSHQGVVLEVGPYPYSSVEAILEHASRREEHPFLLLLDLLHGPQNIGSLLRTAEICGVHGVIIQDRRAPDITPAVVIYSAGAAEHLHIAQVTNLAQTMRRLKEDDIWLVGLDPAKDSQPLSRVNLNMAIGLVVGHEGQGMRRLVRETCDILLRLPMRGNVESLNAAIAASIVLYQAWQARSFEGARPF